MELLHCTQAVLPGYRRMGRLGSGAFLVCLGLMMAAAAAEEAVSHYREIVTGDDPVAYWDFEDDASAVRDAVRSSAAGGDALVASANRKIDFVEGPRLPHYPHFSPVNRAVRFDGRHRLVVADAGDESQLDFDSGDSITLAAWIRPDASDQANYPYIIGKGRTHNAGFGPDNQNYALRLATNDGAPSISFLFRSRSTVDAANSEYHRWTSTAAVTLLDGHWHHVAVTYTFGKADSLRGYIDGQSVAGSWDLGGRTDKPPVVDNDELWIGSSNGGGAGNSFRGDMDAVAVYRYAISAEQIARRYVVDLPELPDVHEQFVRDAEIDANRIVCEIVEGLPTPVAWSFRGGQLTTQFDAQYFALTKLPFKYNEYAVIDSRKAPYLLRMRTRKRLAAGQYRFILRAKSAARLFIGEHLVAETKVMRRNADGHEPVPALVELLKEDMHAVPAGHQEKVVTVELEFGEHLVRLEAMVGGKDLRPELGELCVALAGPYAGGDVTQGNDFAVLGVDAASRLSMTELAWRNHRSTFRNWLTQTNAQLRQAADTQREYWANRQAVARAYVASLEPLSVPQKTALPESAFLQPNLIDRYVNHSLSASQREPLALCDDSAFIRRLALDTVGVIPTAAQARKFLADDRPDKRRRWIDRFLADPRWADHWVGYWQDVLAENPGILKPKLNNTGPFRHWIYESMLDNKPMDRFAHELVMMKGGKYEGGPAGFSMATQNDAPMAEKAYTLTKAFMSMEMKCARCHDAPHHDFQQEQLFNLAALLERKPINLPETSTVPIVPGARQPAITISLKPGQQIDPLWPFPSEVSESALFQATADPREQFAVALTSPQNDRFAKTIVNRLWARYFGRGIIEPVDDWESGQASHPELLEYLARELVANGHDLKHVARLILNSHAYQRSVGSDSVPADRELKNLFAAQHRRRLTAEQLVDSAFAAAGKSFDVGMLTLDPEGRRPYSSFLNLGLPRRAWEFTSLSNERDRPALAMPMAQSVVDWLVTFGWRDARPSPLTSRDAEANMLQPLAMANGDGARRLVQLSDNSEIAALALESISLPEFITELSLRIMSREPTVREMQLFSDVLSKGFKERRVADAPSRLLQMIRERRHAVSWSNHLNEEATRIKMALEELTKRGDLPTERLQSDWRERAEDVVWAMLNSPEFVFVP